MNELINSDYFQTKIGHWGFFGCFMQQTPRAVLSLNRLLTVYNFDTIIELGTHDGGLSTLFALYCLGSQTPAHSEKPEEPSLYKNKTNSKKPKQFYTFDIELRDIPRLKLLSQMGANFQRLDFLNNKEDIEYVQNIITHGKRILLLCDGGNKIKEFEIYSPFLKPNDIIMAHDWAYDAERFKEIQEKGIWYSHETWWEAIRPFCEKHNISQIHAEEFDSSVWFCGIKK